MKILISALVLLSFGAVAKDSSLDRFTKEMQKELNVVSENPHMYETRQLRKPASVEDVADPEMQKKVNDQMEEDNRNINHGKNKWY